MRSCCRSLAVASAVFFSVLAACADPGCIRNSECPVGLECKNAKCVAPGAADGACDASVCASADAGATKQTDAGAATDAAAATTSSNALSSEQAVDAAAASSNNGAEASEPFAP